MSSPTFETLKTAIVSFLPNNKSTAKAVGIGTLVTEQHIVTCAHVVNAVLGRQKMNLDRPDPNEKLTLAFPLHPNDATVEAKVIAWDINIDIAVLETLTPPPAPATPIPFTQTNVFWGRTFRAYGIPQKGRDEQGRWEQGVLREAVANGRIQIENEGKHFIEPGFSGSPVWDETLNGVVGIIVTVDPDEEIHIGRIIPTRLIAKVWPDLPLEKIAPPSRPRADFYRHINMPPNYVPRPELLAEIKAALLSDTGSLALTSAIKMDALHGMGGIGKSVAARALCDDPDIQAAFPDGILWATLGQTVSEAEIRAKLRSWVEHFGGIVSGEAPTLESLKNLLVEQLQNKACLLIVDDVWQRATAEAFQSNVPGCRFLITTRDAAVADELGAEIHPVSVMSPVEAIQLLQEWHKRPLDTELSAVIAKRLGYLPLALKLAGSQLRRQNLQAWLDSFKAQKLKSRRPETPHDNLYDTFDLSLSELTEEDRPLYLRLAIFKEDETIPFAPVARLWNETGGLNEAESKALLQDLADRALLQLDEQSRDEAESVPIATLHDLLRDFIGDELGRQGALQAHRALLNAYRRAASPPQERTDGGASPLAGGIEGGNWHTLPDDGYLYDHLAYHLNQLADSDPNAAAELHALFADDAWLHALVPQNDYRYDGYLADLQLAWQRAEAEALSQIEAGQPPAALAGCVHYALVQTSINSLSANYLPELVARAVETGLWSPERAFSVASRIPDIQQREKMATALLNHLPPKQQSKLRQWAPAAARQIDLKYRAKALTGLAPHLEGEIKKEALQDARNARLIKDALANARLLKMDWQRAEALTGLAPYLDRDQLTQALADARLLRYEDDRAKALTGLAPHLTGEAKKEALQDAFAATRQIKWENDRAKALTGLAPHLNKRLLAQVLAYAQQIKDEYDHAKALIGLALHLDRDWLTQILAASRQIDREDARMIAMAGEYGYTQGGNRQIRNEDDLTEALTGLAPHLTGEAKKEALQDALADARLLKLDWQRAEALTGLAPHLDRDQLTQALADARQIKMEEYRAKALTALAPHLDRDQLTQALAAARQIKWDWQRAKALTALAPHLDRDQLTQALADARLLEDEYGHRAKALTALAPHLDRDQLTQALADARQIKMEKYRAEALTGLATHLEGEVKKEALQDALADARLLKLDWQRAKALTALAPHLEGEVKKEVLQDAFATARLIGYKGDRAKALTKLAPHLNQGLLAQALVNALRQSQNDTRESILHLLATPNLFVPPAVPVDTIAAIANSMDAVCNWWEWI